MFLMAKSILLFKDQDNSTKKKTAEGSRCQINEGLYQRRWVGCIRLLQSHGNWQNITSPNPTNVDV